MGAEILSVIIDTVRPTHVLHIATEKDKHLPALNRLSTGPAATKTDKVKIFSLEPGRVLASRVTAVDLRTLRLVSYFLRDYAWIRDKVRTSSEVQRSKRRSSVSSITSLVGGGGGVGTGGGGDAEEEDVITMEEEEEEEGDGGVYIRNGVLVDREGIIAIAILKLSPFSAPFSSVAIRSIDASVPAHLLLASLNASLVGISVISRSLDDGQEQDTNVNEGMLKLQHQPDASSVSSRCFELDCRGTAPLTHCFGMGIVRAMDVSEQVFFVTTPVDPLRVFSMGKPCLIRGNIQLPTLFLFGPCLPLFPYLSGETAGEGGLQMNARKNVKRHVGGKAKAGVV